MPQFRNDSDDSQGRLASEEALELAAQVAELAKAGLPLEAGLRALADELPGGHLRHALRAMATRLQAGVSLEEALNARDRQLPAHVRALVLAGVRSGRLAEVMGEFVDLQRSQVELQRRVSLAMAYPILLMFLLSGLLVFLNTVVVRGMVEIYEDFEAELPMLTQFVVSTSGPGTWLVVGLTWLLVVTGILFAIAPATAWVSRLFCIVPFIGPLWRFNRLAQFARLMGVFLEQEVPLPSALRLTAEGLRDADLGRACYRVAAEVEAGRPLAESLASRRQFPHSLIPLMQWGQRTAALPEGFRAAAEMFEGRVENQGTLLEAVLLPLTFLLIIVFIGFFVVAMLVPMVSLIQALT
ncbi:MAG: type II secretion system F family protein [Pirellulales bacterium]|nr:type II secretion system F family protein [Pirellulales bacterium]